MSHCPSCGRYAGPYEACPYCGARLVGRMPVRMVKIVAILLSIVGLIALWFAATRAEVPLIQIGQAGATMNMAYVRLEGRCTREPSYDPEGDYLSFWLEDDTAETRLIIEQGRVPALGDMVEAAGTLRVREDYYALTVNVPEQLRIIHADPKEVYEIQVTLSPACCAGLVDRAGNGVLCSGGAVCYGYGQAGIDGNAGSPDPDHHSADCWHACAGKHGDFFSRHSGPRA